MEFIGNGCQAKDPVSKILSRFQKTDHKIQNLLRQLNG